MGVVYQAEDTKLKRTVAIKAMLPTLAASANSGKRFLREAEAMAAVEHDHIVRIYQIDEDRGVPFFAMEFLKGQPLILAGGDTGPAGAIRVCNLATGRQVQALVLGGEPWFFSAQFLPGSKQFVASYNKMKDLYLWDIDSGRVVRTFAGHDEPGPDFTVSPDGKRLLSWNDDKTMRLWNVETGEELRKLEGHADKAAGVFSPDGTQVLTFSPDKTLRLWSVETGKELKKLEGHTDAPLGCFSPDGKQALSYGPDQTIRLWDLATGKEIRRYEGPTDKVNFAGFVADGRLVVGNSADQRFRVWETASGKLLREVDCAPYGGDYWSMTATPDGRHALVNHADGSVRLLDLTTGKEIQCFDNCPKARGFSFAPDGTLAVAGSFRAGVYVFRRPAAAPGQRIDMGKARKTP
jgi:WD40 repeat protein